MRVKILYETLVIAENVPSRSKHAYFV